MPRIYLSPSLQEYNPFYGGGSEEEVMNLIADAMEPYLAADGIEYLRNAPEMTLGQAIADSNNSNVDFHLAIHSNAAPPSVAGTRRGPVVYYYATSPYGRQMAELIAMSCVRFIPTHPRCRCCRPQPCASCAGQMPPLHWLRLRIMIIRRMPHGYGGILTKSEKR